MKPAVVFDNVSKKFRRGERLDSLRDAVPALVRNAFRKRQPNELGDREFWALRDVSFEVAPGEALGIIGPNGAGKSTTLKLLTKIMRPTIGQCAVHGRVGALIEVAAGFHPDLTGRENVYLQGAIMGMKRDEIRKRFDEIVDFAGIDKFVDTPVKRYSSGMNARLGFSIAAHLEPNVLIIDEVLSVGDVSFQQKCFSRMSAFLARGVAVVLVSHNLSAVAHLCRRTALLMQGQCVLLDVTASALAAYCSSQMQPADATSNDPVVIKADFPHRHMKGAWVVGAGEEIPMTVEVQFKKPVDCYTIGFALWDLVRNLRVYGASAEGIGIPHLRGRDGDTAAFEFRFNANLARGTYAIEVNVYDLDAHRHVAILRPAAQFTVAESVSYDGIANLFLSGVQVPSEQPA